jgi:hypothetical protein
VISKQIVQVQGKFIRTREPVFLDSDYVAAITNPDKKNSPISIAKCCNRLQHLIFEPGVLLSGVEILSERRLELLPGTLPPSNEREQFISD